MSERPPALLFIGGSYHQLSAIRSLRNLGLYVAVTDRDESVPGVDIADRFANIDATNTDAMLAFAHELASQCRLIGVYGVADYAFHSAQAVASTFNLLGPKCENPELLSDKAAASERLRSHGQPVPELFWSGSSAKPPSDAQIALFEGRNIVVKPRSMNNSAGVQIIKQCTTDDVRESVGDPRSGSNNLMIEAFVDGLIGNVDGLMIDGRYIPVSTTVRCSDPDKPNVSITTIQPAGLPGFNERAHQLAQGAAVALGYRTGPVTVDLVIGQTGELQILEVSPHYHNISCEIVRGNGNPMAAYGSWLMQREDWFGYLPRSEGRQGVYYQKFVTGSSRIHTRKGLDALFKIPGVVDALLVRNPPKYTSLQSNNNDLLYQIWATAETREALDKTIERIEYEVNICA